MPLPVYSNIIWGLSPFITRERVNITGYYTEILSSENTEMKVMMKNIY